MKRIAKKVKKKAIQARNIAAWIAFDDLEKNLLTSHKDAQPLV